MRCIANTGLVLCLGAFFMVPAVAQDFPKGPVKVIVPFVAGGPTDAMARMVGAKLQEIWGQPVVMEYKPGAGTVLGVDAVAKSPPDGYTVGIVPAALTVNPSLRKSMPYDTVKDISGVTQLVATHLALVTGPKAPFNTVAELVAYAKSNPGKVSFGSPGVGGTAHLAGELLKRTAGFEMEHIPYKGSAQAIADLMGGRIDLMFDALSSALPFVKSGKFKMIATNGARRAPGNEQYPTVAETFPGFEVTSLLGMIIPSAAPRPIVRRIQADTAKALNMPDVKKIIEAAGSEVVGSTPEQFDALIQRELMKWAKVVAAAGIPKE
ncbi:MAG: MFS transporter [Betaproteobacteria bacterium RIFCSPLOWO2_02_FULL_62_17]|nr:MAG: MFS transporter [Betaproteobacteria bacterium RIFCSPLOWO2_02_FULL_62_17]